jgi:Kae1-associated kinase Bud32
MIANGAEAIIYRKNNNIIKKRVKKLYRIEQLDKKIRRRRTKSEKKLLKTALELGLSVPRVIRCSDNEIEMEFIRGHKLKNVLSKKEEKERRVIMSHIAEDVSTLHNFNIIHGDLTTSNIIQKGGEIYFIDFGLGFHSNKSEDKATDIHLFKECLESTHPTIAKRCWTIFLKVYMRYCNDASEVIKKLGRIEKRGRYKKR